MNITISVYRLTRSNFLKNDITVRGRQHDEIEYSTLQN